LKGDCMALYAVFNIRVANKLEKQGFKVIKMDVNHKNPRYMVYYFEDSVELREAIHPLITRKK